MDRLISILYEIGLWLIAIIALPKLIYNCIVQKKYRTNFLVRLGIRYPNFVKNQHPLVWIHAVSVGEAKAVTTLAREIKRQFPQAQLVISSVTETGHAEVKRSLPFADYHVYLPFDFRPIVRRIISSAQPDLIILCETDLWFNFLRFAKKQGATIALVSGKLSESSMKRFQKVLFFSKRLLNLFNIIDVQNTLYRDRFLAIGAPQNKVVITGNLKLDEEYPHLSPEEINQWRQRLGIRPDQLVLTVGSTHDPEEQIVLEVLKDVWKKVPDLKVLLVPRHPERFKEVGALLTREGISFINYTDINSPPQEEQVILIDAMGLLRMCYQLSDVALVGGSFTMRVGGHNILEPCWYEKPVLFGPYMHTQLELVSFIEQYRAGKQVKNELELKEVLIHWLENSLERKQVGDQGLHLVQDLRGSTQQTLSTLLPFLQEINRLTAKV